MPSVLSLLPVRRLGLALALLLAVPAAPFLDSWDGTPAPASAAQSESVVGQYVPLDKPVRVFDQRISATEMAGVTAIGVGGIPRAGTTGVMMTVTGSNNEHDADLVMRTYSPDGWSRRWAQSLHLNDGQTHAAANTIALPVDNTRTTRHLEIWEDDDWSALTVKIDVVGYFIDRPTVGGGFVPVRHETLFDTRANGGAAIPAGGTFVKTLTGGVIPRGSQAAHLDLIATSIGANGGIAAVPNGIDVTDAAPMLRFATGGGSYSNLVVTKVAANGQVRFKNTSTAPVHVVARAVGYTSSAVVGGDYLPEYPAHWELTIPADTTKQVAIGTDNQGGAALANLTVTGTTASGSLRVWPSDQEPQNATSVLNFGGMTDVYRERKSGAVLVPGLDGKVSFTNTAAKAITLDVWVTGRYRTPTQLVAAGGTDRLAMATVPAGACYARLDEGSRVVAGCTDGLGSGQPTYASLGPVGHQFRGPVTIDSRPGGGLVVTAVHAPDGELWTWQFGHSTAALSPKTVRSFRHVRAPLVTATLPTGAPVGLAEDDSGRMWAVDLDVAAPTQPRWIPLDVPPGTGRVEALDAVGTSTGIQVAAVKATGTGAEQVVTGLLTSTAATSLTWAVAGQGSYGALSLGVAGSGQARLVVRTGDEQTMASLSLDAGGQPVGAWAPVNTTVGGAAVRLTGSPEVVYDPMTRESLVLFRSDASTTGGLYRVRESVAGSGVFDKEAPPISLTSAGIGSDVTSLDHRAYWAAGDPGTGIPRWSIAYRDSYGGSQGFTSSS